MAIKRICDSPDKCTACGMCGAICPSHAISFLLDDEGFRYPSVDSSLCVDCSLCHNLCPQNGFEPTEESFKSPSSRMFFAFAKDKRIRTMGSSGGVFPALATAFLAKGWIIYGAAFDARMHLRHIRITEEQYLSALCTSKYIESEADDAYRSVLNDLKEGRNVFFVGTPCQIHAIKKMSKNNELLFTADLICYGTGSTNYFFDFLQEKERQHGSKTKSFIFRKKIYGEHDGFTSIEFQNGEKDRSVFFLNEFGIPFSGRLIIRKSCFSCRFSSDRREGDITLGDYRRPIKGGLNPFQLKKGASLIRVNSDKAFAVLQELIVEKKLFIQPVNNKAMDGRLVRSAPEVLPREKRDRAMKCYREEGYSSFVNHFCKIDPKNASRLKRSYFYSIIKWILKRG